MGFVEQDASYTNLKIQRTTSVNQLTSCNSNTGSLVADNLIAENATITNLTVVNPLDTAVNAVVPLQGNGTVSNPLSLSLPFAQLGDKLANTTGFYSAVPQLQYPIPATYSSQIDTSGLVNPVPFVTIVEPGVYRLHMDSGAGASGLTGFVPPYIVSIEGRIILNGSVTITICRMFLNVPTTNSADTIIQSISGDMLLALTTGDTLTFGYTNISTSPALASNVFLFNPTANLEYVHSP